VSDRPRRPSVRLSPEEAWQAVSDAHTGIFTTLRRDGVPVSLPVWFVTLDHQVIMRTPATAKKVARVRTDPRSSFLVEAGLRWAELRAVHLTGRAEVVDDDGRLAEEIAPAWEAKYGGYTTARTAMPDATRTHYEVPFAYVRFTPDERIVSWDNRRLGLT